METYQNEDGSITVPDVLRPYMGGVEKIGAAVAATASPNLSYCHPGGAKRRPGPVNARDSKRSAERQSRRPARMGSGLAAHAANRD